MCEVKFYTIEFRKGWEGEIHREQFLIIASVKLFLSFVVAIKILVFVPQKSFLNLWFEVLAKCFEIKQCLYG